VLIEGIVTVLADDTIGRHIELNIEYAVSDDSDRFKELVSFLVLV
jgi:hypothetical protein